MSPIKAARADQHAVLHQSWPPPTCCLCNTEAEIERLTKERDELRVAFERFHDEVIYEFERIDGVLVLPDDMDLVLEAISRAEDRAALNAAASEPRKP